MTPLIGITTDIEGKHSGINRQYARAVEDAGAGPVLLTPLKDVKSLALKIDGLLISGGDDLHPSYYNEKPAYDMKIVEIERSDFEFKSIREIIELRKPVLGICYGMQLINVAFGGNLYQDIASQLSTAMNHKGRSHAIEVGQNRILKRGLFEVNSSHHQAVKGLGKGLKAIAFSADNIIEAIWMEDYPFLLGVQWHPERMEDDFSGRIFRAFAEACAVR